MRHALQEKPLNHSPPRTIEMENTYTRKPTMWDLDPLCWCKFKASLILNPMFPDLIFRLYLPRNLQQIRISLPWISPKDHSFVIYKAKIIFFEGEISNAEIGSVGIWRNVCSSCSTVSTTPTPTNPLEKAINYFCPLRNLVLCSDLVFWRTKFSDLVWFFTETWRGFVLVVLRWWSSTIFTQSAPLLFHLESWPLWWSLLAKLSKWIKYTWFDHFTA